MWRTLTFTMLGGENMKDTYKILMLLFAFGTFLVMLLTFIFQYR